MLTAIRNLFTPARTAHECPQCGATVAHHGYSCSMLCASEQSKAAYYGNVSPDA
jgi:hypothetical protein